MKNGVLLGIIFILVFLAYLPSINGGFVFDDSYKIANNIYLKDVKYWGEFFKGKEDQADFMITYRPLLMVTFSLNYFVSKLNTFGYHLINILIHLLNVYLLFLFLNQLFPHTSTSAKLFFVALFGLHPINTEAVSYISSRSDLLAACFLLLGAIFYLRQRYVLVCFLYATGLLFKESVVVLPGVLFALDFFIVKRLDRKKLYHYLGMICIFVLFLLVRKVFIGKVGYPTPLRSAGTNIATQALVSFFYLRLFLLPYPLCMDHLIAQISLLSPAGMGFCAAIIALFILALVMRNKYPYLGLAIFIYYIGLSVKFAATLNYYASEHHAYFSLVGPCILGVFCLGSLTKPKRLIKYASICILSILFMLTLLRNFDWQTEYSLWRSTYKVNQRSGPAMLALGLHYLNMGLYDKAEEYFILVTERSPKISAQTRAFFNLITTYIKLEQYEDATRINEQALVRYPGERIKFLICKKLILGGQEKDTAEVRKEVEELVNEAPYEIKGRIALGVWYVQDEEYAKAKEYLLEAKALNPVDSEVHSFLGMVYEREGDLARAKEEYSLAIRSGSQSFRDYYNLGTILAREANPQAEVYLKKAIALAPHSAESYFNLALLYVEQGRPKSQWQYYLDKALKLGYKIDEGLLKLIGGF